MVSFQKYAKTLGFAGLLQELADVAERGMRVETDEYKVQKD